MQLPPAAVMSCLIAAGTAGGCSFMSPVRGTLSNGETFTGYLREGGGIEFQIGKVWCSGTYQHAFSLGRGAVKCADGREGDFSMISSPELRPGPGHDGGRATGSLAGQELVFDYGSGSLGTKE